MRAAISSAFYSLVSMILWIFFVLDLADVQCFQENLKRRSLRCIWLLVRGSDQFLDF